MSRDAGFAPMPDGGRIAFTAHGADRGTAPLLLVRALGGSSSLWGEFRERLAEERRVITYDYRRTRHSSTAHPRSTRALAADALALIEHLGLAHVHVFGLSLGGMVATWIAADGAAKVLSSCLAAAPLRGIDLGLGGLRNELSLARCFFRREREVEVAIVRRILSPRFCADRPTEVERIERIVRGEALPRARLLERALAGVVHDGRDAARSIACPTLVLRGEHDTLLAPRPARELARAVRSASFETIPDAGHDVTLEAPEATADRVLAFLRSRP